MRDIHVSHPSGGEAVQIGCPADLSGIPPGMTGYNHRFGSNCEFDRSQAPAWEWGFEAPASQRTTKQELAR